MMTEAQSLSYPSPERGGSGAQRREWGRLSKQTLPGRSLALAATLPEVGEG